MKQIGLSESSIKKYLGAMEGVLTEWAVNSGIIDVPLTSVSSLSKFKIIRSEIQDLEIYKARDKIGHGMYKSALLKYEEYLSSGFSSTIEDDIDSILDDDIDSILDDDSLSDTEKKQLVKARIGQGKFRKSLISMWEKCSVTGYADASFLVASHIKPWSASDNIERLDCFNGLLLIANIDKAFDKGFITFDSEGNILISRRLKDPEKLGIFDTMKVALSEKHAVYMDYHRKEVFLRK